MMEVPRVVALCMEGLEIGNALDVGTGTGVFAEAFAKAGIAATGIDLNAELLETARSLAPSCIFLEGVAEKLPFPDRSFDLAFLGMVLHEADDAQEALKEAHRVSRRRVAVLEWQYRTENGGPPLEHRMKSELIADLAKNAGFAKIETTHLQRLALYTLER